jgi:hypothetical protein
MPFTHDYDEYVVLSNQTITTEGDSGTLEGYGRFNQLLLVVGASAFGGSNPLRFELQDSIDGVNWNALVSPLQIIGNGQFLVRHSGVFADRLRVVWYRSNTGAPSTTDITATLAAKKG